MLFRTVTFHGDNDVTITGIPGSTSGGPQRPDSYEIDLPGATVTLSTNDLQSLYWAITAVINLTTVSML